jgi:hypothetical protein
MHVATHPPEANPLQFFATAATVIPVFVLAGLYQANVTKMFDPAIRFLGLAVFSPQPSSARCRRYTC